MKILIYETVHLDWVMPLAEILDTADFEVSFVVSEEMQDDIEKNVHNKGHYKWYYVPDKIKVPKLFAFLDKLCELHKYDLLWLNTASSRHALFASIAKKHLIKLIVNVHDVNNLFRSKFSHHLKQSIRHLSKKRLVKQANAFIVNAERMKLYIEENTLSRKPVYWVPPVFYKSFKNGDNEKFSVVISGTVTQKRRDYQTALASWKIFNDKTELKNAELILAGALEDKELKPLIKSLQYVKYYTEIIKEDVFQNTLKSASVLLSPQTIIAPKKDGIGETYGLTKNSGNSYDAIRNAKPFIVPEELIVPKELNESVIKYTDAENLAEELYKLYSDENYYKQKTEQAVKASSVFTIESVRDKIKNMITEITA